MAKKSVISWWLALHAALLALLLVGAIPARLALGQAAKPDQPQQTAAGPAAPAVYSLCGDCNNTIGTSYTVFSTNNTSSTPFAWDFVDTDPGATTLRASGTRVGVHGAGSSYGVYGTSEGTAGVYGFSTSTHGVYGESSSGYGVYGTSSSSNGVFGTSSSSSASGVYGENLSGGIGVAGRNNSTDPDMPAVLGNATGNGGTGVYGTSDSGAGVHGHSTDGNGVFGTSSSNNASGVYGENLSGGYGVAGRSNSSSTSIGAVYGDAVGGGIGVLGKSFSGMGVSGVSDSSTGVYGFSESGYGMIGRSYSSSVSGVYGENLYGGYGVRGTGTSGIGVFGQSSSNIGIYGKSTSGSGVYGQSTSGIAFYGASSSSYGLYVSTVSGTIAMRAINPNKASGLYAGYFDGNVRINGSYVATGTKSALVYTTQGERLMYAEEATRNYFSDQGTATLKDGRAVIKIDPLFAQTVSLSEGYQVFAMPASAATAGLAVINQTEKSFEIVELQHGKGSFSFHWRITALRKGYEKQRMELAPPAAPVDMPADLKGTTDK